MKQRVTFVCLGNICRSPLAAGVFKHLVKQAGRAQEFHIESAGVGGWHVGEAADRRSQQVARQHGITLEGRAQQFKERDFERFDWVLALDADIYADLQRLAPNETARAKVHLLRETDPEARGDYDVPDPYYGGLDGFEQAYQMIERACQGWLERMGRNGNEGE